MKFAIILLITCPWMIMVALAQEGVIKGRVTDAKTGETLVGVNVYLDGTTTGSSTDIDGNFTINHVKEGNYIVVASFITYSILKKQSVSVNGGQITTINLALLPTTQILDAVEISAKAGRNTEDAILTMQSKSASMQDGISSREMAKAGGGNAAESAKMITGTSVVDGKYVFVRGLGDRYTTAQLNGASLISTDPYMNSAPLDIIPSNLLDNIITTKTATPDKPGNFTGGIINLTTRDIPEKRIFSMSQSITYNPQSSFNNRFLTYEGGKSDWLGYDDGTRDLPAILQDESNLALLSSPLLQIMAKKNSTYANLLDKASKSLSSQMAPTTTNSFTNHSTSLSFGNKYKLLNKPLGIMMGMNFSRNFSSYDNGRNQAWDLTGTAAEELFTYYDLSDNKSTENPQLSGVAGATYQFNKHHEIGLLQIYNHDTEKMARYQRGHIPGKISGQDKIFETRTLKFTERGLSTTQLKGSHTFSRLRNSKLNWISAFTSSFQDEPDLRFFANETVGDSVYYISVSEYDLPYHYFRYLNDKASEFKIDFTIPFTKNLTENSIKTGISIISKEREFEEYRFYFKNKNGLAYNGDQFEFFGADNTGVINYDASSQSYVIGNYLVNNTKVSNNYRGSEQVNAAFAMVTLRLNKRIKFNGGVRVEQTQMKVESADSNQVKGDIDQFNFFPSGNLIFEAGKKMNVRASYSTTIARPTMRELAPFVTYDFIGGFVYLGNPKLLTTTINNYDLRWEYFIKPGEVVAVSGYYKHFSDPIVKAYNTVAINPEIIYQNTNDADVYGVELDVRKNLSFISHTLKNFKANANFSYIISKVALDTTEYRILAQINPELDPYRPFQGQSPLLFNVALSYENEKHKAGADLNFSFNGKRMSSIGLNGLPDVYEQPTGLMNLSIHKSLSKYLALTLRIDNILDSEYLTQQSFKGNVYNNESHRNGTGYGIKLTWKI